MPSDNISIFKIKRSYKGCVVWHASKDTHELVVRSSLVPDEGLSRKQRYDVITEWLKERCGLIAPCYEPTQAEVRNHAE